MYTCQTFRVKIVHTPKRCETSVQGQVKGDISPVSPSCAMTSSHHKPQLSVPASHSRGRSAYPGAYTSGSLHACISLFIIYDK